LRELKFRGQRADSGEWVHGNYVYDGKHYITQPLINSHRLILVDHSTVGQFTGLQDINKVDIYEGDLVRHGYKSNNGEFFDIMSVSFSNNYGGWIVGNYNILTTKNIGKYSVEVVGNIYTKVAQGADI
jgi:hypothetical protein